VAVFPLIFICLSGGIDVDSLTAALHVETGMAYLSQGLSEKALTEFNTALELSDTAYEAYLGIGRASAIHGSWDMAEASFLEFLACKPFDHRPARELAEMLLGFPGRFQDALMYADMALALAPLDGQCRLTAADARAALGRTEEALSAYTLIINENPEFASAARLRLGGYLFEYGRLADAREVLLPAALSGEAEAHRLLCLVYLDQHDHLRARDSAGRYIFLEPNGVWADSARTILEELSFESAPGNPGD